MEKNLFLKVVNLYKSEKNLTRLVYRLIKYESEENKEDKQKWLSRNQIWAIAQKIIYSKAQIENELNRIESEKHKIIEEKIEMLKKSGYREIEKLDNNCLKYKDRETDYVFYNNFPIEFNNLDKTYFSSARDSIEKAIDYLLSIEYIKEYQVKNINPYKKSLNLGKTARYKAIK